MRSSTGVHYEALTHRARLLAAGFAIFFLGSWLAIFAPFNDCVDRFGAPLGGDFPMFYVAGQSIVAGHSDELYDDAAQQASLHRTFPQLASNYTLPFRYPPLVAYAMAPLAALNYPCAFALFALSMIAAWWTAATLLARGIAPLDQQLATSAWWLMLAWPVGWEAILGGQASPAALLIVALVWHLLRCERQVLAGAVLALAAYKPNVLAFFVLGCLMARPRMLYGAASVWVVCLAATWMAVGREGIEEYLTYGSRLALEPWQQETPFWKVHGLGSVLAPVTAGYERAVLLALGLMLTGRIAWHWRKQVDQAAAARAVCALLVVNFLCNPYVPIYDVLLLLAAAAIAIQSCTGASFLTALGDVRVRGMGLLLLAGPHVSQGLARPLGLQIFPIVLLGAVLAWCWDYHRATRTVSMRSQAAA